MTNGDRFLNATIEKANRLLKGCSIRKARKYCRKGCPVNVRPAMWIAATQSYNTLETQRAFDQQSQDADQSWYITDDMYRMDVSFTMNDPNYFPFEDILLQVMLVFARDDKLRQDAKFQIHEYVYDDSIIIPPCGVQPFHGLVMYAAPLCYLFQDPVQIYLTFRAMYATLWCRLNVIRSESNTLLRLCLLFEQLVQQHVPDLVLKLSTVRTSAKRQNPMHELPRCNFIR